MFVCETSLKSNLIRFRVNRLLVQGFEKPLKWELLNCWQLSTHELKLRSSQYSQWIFREIRFETDGGTELLAIHRYDPISLRAILVSFKVSPRNDATARKKRKENRRISNSFPIPKNLPWVFVPEASFKIISLPSSRLQVTTGSGYPLHLDRAQWEEKKTLDLFKLLLSALPRFWTGGNFLLFCFAKQIVA